MNISIIYRIFYQSWIIRKTEHRRKIININKYKNCIITINKKFYLNRIGGFCVYKESSYLSSVSHLIHEDSLSVPLDKLTLSFLPPAMEVYYTVQVYSVLLGLADHMI